MDITAIIQAVIALLSAIVTAVLVPWIRSRTTEAQRTEIEQWVRIAVSAAEQIYHGAGRGEEKKNYVITWLLEHDIIYDAATIDAMIEAEVYRIKEAI